MFYRLLCISEPYVKPAPVIRIEVCLEGNSKTIAPFQRKVTLNDIRKSGVSTSKELITLLNHAGLTNQPFRIPLRLLEAPLVQQIILRHPYNYVESAPKGSIKKGHIQMPSCTQSENLKMGRLIGGELYINDVTSWHRNIQVRLRYADALSNFYPDYSPLPFITSDNQLMQRDQNAELSLLATIRDVYDAETATLTLDTPDTQLLKKFTNNGWTLYVPNQQKVSKVYAHHEPSGIIWFSTDDIPSSDFAQQLLDGYLNSRNYHESDGHITFFQRKDAEKSDDKTTIKLLGGTTDVLQLYQENVPLSSSERQFIKDTINKKILATLRTYQEDGVFWLQQQRKNCHGCLLADEMGLGKTLQVIAHLCCLGNNAQHLIIAPTSLIYNWQNEVLHFAPQLKSQLTFVSYDMLRIHLEDYVCQQYDTIIIDEAQIIKNRQTKKYQAISQLNCKHKIILTGTPIENSIDELWSHFMMLMPPMKSLYRRLHQLGVQTLPEAYINITSKLLKPFILRREKQSVLSDLPERIEKVIYIELKEQERKNYQNVHTAILHAFTTGLSGRLSSIALEGLLRLRQACISAKYPVAIDYIEAFRSEGHQVLVFSQFVTALRQMESKLQEAGIRFVTLYGDTRDRKTPVERFQSDSSITVFLISLKAGGVGLNLTAADRVILLDDWWNPAVEDQAMGRSHRIGQKKNVLALRLVCKDTVEEKILLLQNRKRQTTEQFNAANEHLSLEDLKALID
jgi:superfamily II DNA or RNA helicase